MVGEATPDGYWVGARNADAAGLIVLPISWPVIPFLSFFVLAVDGEKHE